MPDETKTVQDTLIMLKARAESGDNNLTPDENVLYERALRITKGWRNGNPVH